MTTKNEYVKVTYKTSEGNIVNTFVPADRNIEYYMYQNYDNVEVIAVKKSVKKGYKHYLNKIKK